MRVLVLATALLAGCMPRLGGSGDARTQELTVGAARFIIVYWPEDAAAAREVRRALEAAVPRAARWGGLPEPVTVTLHPTHGSLEEAANRPGYDWLRGWARFATIDIQSPRTWGFFGASERKLEELVTHELTHCAMYQRSGDEHTWMYKKIPPWFSEGIASITAGQRYAYAGIEQLFAFYRENAPGSGDGIPIRDRGSRAVDAQPGDPMVDPDPLYGNRWDVAYGAAYQAAQFLVTRYGDARVIEVLRLMGEGLNFPRAFKQAIGLSEEEFAADFRRYVVWQGWRR